MLLESRLADDTALFIDCETVAGFDKSDAASDFHPDDAVKHVCRIAWAIAAELAATARAAAGVKPAPGGLELEFGIKIDSKAIVSISQNIDAG